MSRLVCEHLSTTREWLNERNRDIRKVVNPFRRNRVIVFSLFALVLVVLSFHGVLDNLASSKIDDLTKENLVLLGLSIAIDAGVSFLQTIEFKIPFLASAKPLQALDPIKDGAKRLTDMMLWATGSLVLQGILLKITSGTIFKWGFLAIAALTAASLLLAQSSRIRIAFATSLGVSHVAFARFQGFLIKTFIVATIVRFIVPTFAIASLLVSQALLAPEIRQYAEAIEGHEKSLSEVGAQISEAHDEVIKEQESREEIQSHEEAEDSVPDKATEPVLSPSAQPAFRSAEDLRLLRE